MSEYLPTGQASRRARGLLTLLLVLLMALTTVAVGGGLVSGTSVGVDQRGKALGHIG